MIDQKRAILRHLQARKSITPLEALKRYGCFRLAARIQELRQEHRIDTETVKRNGKRYARYVLRGAA